MSGTVFVFGSINADTSYRMSALPLPGETVLARAADVSPGGKGANQAIAASAAGGISRMVGVVGDDAEGGPLLDALAARGVDTAGVSVRSGARTGRAVVAVDDSGENAIIVLSGANELLDDAVAADGLCSLTAGDVVVLQNEVPASANRAAARLARASGATVIWNAAPAPVDPADLVDEVDLLVVNEHELTQIAALLGIGHSHAAAGHDRLAQLLALTVRALTSSTGSAPDAICTLGGDGALYLGAGRSGHIPAPPVHAVDTTAAGDTVVGYLAAHASLPLDERLHLASAAGALTVTRTGASSSIPTLAEVEQSLARLTERTPI